MFSTPASAKITTPPLSSGAAGVWKLTPGTRSPKPARSAAMASAAAWSPNPGRPPFFLDLPVENGEVRPDVVARQVANAIHAMVPQHAANLRRLEALAVDTGDRDGSITGATERLGELLDTYRVPHDLEVYPGDHLSGVEQRVEENVLPFFSRHLDAPGPAG